MTDLPRDRIEAQVFQFTYTGVDFFGNQVLTTFTKEMLLVHLPNKQSSTYRIGTIIGHRVKSSCSARFLARSKIESDLVQKKIVWKINTPGAPHFGRICD